MRIRKSGVDQSLVEILDILKDQLKGFGVCWFWQDVDFEPNMENSLYAESVDAVIDVAPFVFFEHAQKNASHFEWTASELTFEHKNYHTHIYCVPVDKHEDSILMLLSETSQNLPEHILEEIYWATQSLGFKRKLISTNNELSDLQNHMRYQVVWAECIEWTKNIVKEDKNLYQELLTRLMLISNSTKGAILVDGKGEFSVCKGCKNESIKNILKVLRAKGHDLDRMSDYILENASPQSNNTSPLELHEHILIGPAKSAARNRKVTIVLSKPNIKAPYTITDHVYIEQIISSVFMGLDKNSLMRALARSNKALKHEQETQKELIQQLQEAQEQLLQSEKMASIGQLAAGVAHEINNPIGFVKTNISVLGEYSQTLLDTLKNIRQQLDKHPDQSIIKYFNNLLEEIDLEELDEDLPELLEDANDGITRVRDIVNDLKDFSRTDTGHLVMCDIHNPIKKALNIAHNEIKYKIDVETDYAEDLPDVEIVESQIGQVVLNFIVNAAHAIDERGIIKIKTEQLNDDHISFSISDTGHGIDETTLKKIFDPFFTTKPVGKGTGLGLSLSYGIIQRHNGNIKVASKKGKGTTFTTILPIKQPLEKEETDEQCSAEC
ncbi:sensor histidine kinase [Litoribacillus peritrichatus]|uniref:histidine kinase n=1 Tax=Litoribacillus peritrichatus TaxID=718191 RepID=A0ABP7MGB7_9GAMM